MDFIGGPRGRAQNWNFSGIKAKTISSLARNVVSRPWWATTKAGTGWWWMIIIINPRMLRICTDTHFHLNKQQRAEKGRVLSSARHEQPEASGTRKDWLDSVQYIRSPETKRQRTVLCKSFGDNKTVFVLVASATQNILRYSVSPSERRAVIPFTGEKMPVRTIRLQTKRKRSMNEDPVPCRWFKMYLILSPPTLTRPPERTNHPQ